MSLILAITTGEPAGIGPDITIQALLQLYGFLTETPDKAEIAQSSLPRDLRFNVLGNRKMLSERASMLGLDDKWQLALQTQPIEIEDHALIEAVIPGKLNAKNASYVLNLLDSAINDALSGRFNGIVTAPLHKGILNQPGYPLFTGHTEYLAQRTQTKEVVMMLAGGGFRVALVTTHLPLREVADAITQEKLLNKLTIIDRDLRRWFGIERPRILVTGLNPHAGEQGHLGYEDDNIILPAIQIARAQGIAASGPYPADTLFHPRYLEQADCVLAMYHDQGLPVLKYASFGHGVNITVGLPIIRTSVDHGTALDRAGSSQADYGSLIAAIKTAVEMGTLR